MKDLEQLFAEYRRDCHFAVQMYNKDFYLRQARSKFWFELQMNGLEIIELLDEHGQEIVDRLEKIKKGVEDEYSKTR